MVQESTQGRTSKLHAIVIPLPLQGHVIPAVHLATKLASNGFTVTFVNTHYIHHQISSSSSAASSSDDIFDGSGLDIRYETITDGFPLGFDRSLNHDQFFEGILHVFPAHVEELLQRLAAAQEDQRLRLMIADTFFVWPSALASKYGMLYASFWTEPALVLTLYFHLDLLKLHGHFGCQKNREDSIDYIPGVKRINPKDVMSYLQPTCNDTNTICHRIIYRAFADAKRADFIVINTVHGLEPEIITALNKAQPTYPIGPIFPPGFTKGPVSTSLWPESDCSTWLAAQPDRSVLYVSFGSYAHTSKEVIHAMAHGLLRSSARFIWAIRPDIVSSDDPNPLPDGFEERARGKGMVVTWCSQREVLMDRAVGGFLTHCGWNSVLESVWCGVPLLCYPLYTDQFTNRKLVVDDWSVGINLCDGDCVTGDEVARNIDRLMMGESADELRVHVEKMRKIIEDALADGGSSQGYFDKFVEDAKVKVDKIYGLGC
uniref:Glycosyltransferase n=1 Tax=Rheum officinale TaxID=137220 RepID=A0A7L9A2H0_RHEOF|nr:glycosyltransferase [Rheum officinale]